jgi:rhodanese-related sulfurtransferase
MSAPKKRFTRRSVLAALVPLALVGGLLWDGSPLGTLAVHLAVRAKFKDVRQVSPAELAAWKVDPNRPPPLLVDARPPEQFAVSHIDGAVSLDPTDPDLAALKNVGVAIPIVVYDGPGVVGAAMTRALAAAGYTRLSNLDGGLFRWVNEGHPVVNDAGPATTVSPINWWWGRLLKARYRP